MKCLTRLFEEVFPFVAYFKNKNRLLKRLEQNDILSDQNYQEYETLPQDLLEQRLKDEHKRAVSIDDKTFKLTLTLSIGFSVFGSIAAYLGTEILTDSEARPSCLFIYEILVNCLFAVGLLYIFIAGWLAVGVVRTHETNGYGTDFMVKVNNQGKTVVAEALARQETRNQTRVLRNEAAYQCLRNGTICIFVGVILNFVMKLIFNY